MKARVDITSGSFLTLLSSKHKMLFCDVQTITQIQWNLEYPNLDYPNRAGRSIYLFSTVEAHVELYINNGFSAGSSARKEAEESCPVYLRQSEDLEVDKFVTSLE